MNPRAVRIKKEARALFWPWCAVVIVGALPIFVPHSYAEHFSGMGFFFGIPLLATLSIGNEFHQRTLSLWLTQPASRMQLWGEKMSVMFPAVLSAGLVCAAVMFTITWPQLGVTFKVAAAAYVIVAMASATFWTLAARSTIGGFLVITCVLVLASLFAGQIESMSRDRSRTVTSSAATITAISAFAICFSVLMVLLGTRKLAQFQATGASSGEDLLMAGPTLVPETLAESFRCRRSGAFLNLIRKEFRLLRPLWLIEVLAVLYVGFLGVFRLLPAPPVVVPRTVVEWVLLGPFVMTSIGMAGLAGILPLGEERRSGTHAWHMTLPISARRQWLIKLVMAMLAGPACALLFPTLIMMATGAVYGSAFLYVDLGTLHDNLIIFPILTFACFWCSCAANGTVRAATWAMPLAATIPFAASGGLRLGEVLARSTGTLKDFVVSWFHLSPLASTTITDWARARVLWLFIPVLVLALIQSYRLFRTQRDESALRMLRSILPLVAMTFLWSFSASAGFMSSRWEPFAETRQALDRLQPGTAKLALTGEDLANGSRLTVPTRRWLRGSIITVAPGQSRLPGYLATIHLASGLECRLTVSYHGGTAASCVR